MNIEHAKQNHPELIVDQLNDIYPDIHKNMIRYILKYTGINKWLKNRRYIIDLKNKWKIEIAKLQKDIQHYKYMMNHTTGRLNNKYTILYHKAKERMNTIADCRQQVRTICHSNRDYSFNTNSYKLNIKLPDNFPKRPHTKYLKMKGL